MYIPKTNLTTDKTEIVAFMKQFSFATIITAKDSAPIATHLPFIVTTKDDNIILTSHFAKANEHWQNIEKKAIRILFIKKTTVNQICTNYPYVSTIAKGK